MYELNDKKIGEHLKKLIDERGYKSTADFCRRYLIEKNNTVNYTEDNLNEDLKTAKNTFSKIISGKQRITLEQLPILSKLLCVSCEEILSAGKKYAPTINHITNYEIAQSHDRKDWDEYMKREDKLFLNCDEYRKSVIDYAFEFKNYAFMKYLLEEGFIWFVDNSKEGFEPYYGADTTIKSNWDRFNMPDQFLSSELHENDRLRTQTIAMAIENEDYDILESLRARDIPEIHMMTWSGLNNFDIYKNDNLIETIAKSTNDRIIDYFSDEFDIMIPNNKIITVVFPFLSDAIEKMLETENEKAAAVALKKVITHNKDTFNKINDMIKAACKLHHDSLTERMESLIKACMETGCGVYDEKTIKRYKEDADDYRHIYSTFNVDKYNNVCFYYRNNNGKYTDIMTNIFKVTSKKGSPEIKKLIIELNEWYKKILSLGGEKYAEILL